MFSFLRIKLFIYILIFSACVNVTNKKKPVSSNDKFYKIENIDKNDIISDVIEIYDTNKMILFQISLKYMILIQ